MGNNYLQTSSKWLDFNQTVLHYVMNSIIVLINSNIVKSEIHNILDLNHSIIFVQYSNQLQPLNPICTVQN